MRRQNFVGISQQQLSNQRGGNVASVNSVLNHSQSSGIGRPFSHRPVQGRPQNFNPVPTRYSTIPADSFSDSQSQTQWSQSQPLIPTPPSNDGRDAGNSSQGNNSRFSIVSKQSTKFNEQKRQEMPFEVMYMDKCQNELVQKLGSVSDKLTSDLEEFWTKASKKFDAIEKEQVVLKDTAGALAKKLDEVKEKSDKTIQDAASKILENLSGLASFPSSHFQEELKKGLTQNGISSGSIASLVQEQLEKQNLRDSEVILNGVQVVMKRHAEQLAASTDQIFRRAFFEFEQNIHKQMLMALPQLQKVDELENKLATAEKSQLALTAQVQTIATDADCIKNENQVLEEQVKVLTSKQEHFLKNQISHHQKCSGLGPVALDRPPIPSKRFSNSSNTGGRDQNRALFSPNLIREDDSSQCLPNNSQSQASTENQSDGDLAGFSLTTNNKEKAHLVAHQIQSLRNDTFAEESLPLVGGYGNSAPSGEDQLFNHENEPASPRPPRPLAQDSENDGDGSPAGVSIEQLLQSRRSAKKRRKITPKSSQPQPNISGRFAHQLLGTSQKPNAQQSPKRTRRSLRISAPSHPTLVAAQNNETKTATCLPPQLTQNRHPGTKRPRRRGGSHDSWSSSGEMEHMVFPGQAQPSVPKIQKTAARKNAFVYSDEPAQPEEEHDAFSFLAPEEDSMFS